MAFEREFGTDVQVHTVDACGSEEIQESMFLKMIEAGCQAVVVELMEDSDVRYYQSLAAQHGIQLLLTGYRPASLESGVVYLGDGSWNLAKTIASETWEYWNNHRDLIDHRAPEGELTYSTVTAEGFEKSGSKEIFEQTLQNNGLPVTLVLDSVRKTPNYDLHREIDNTLYGKSELILCDNSADAQRIVDYWNDPAEFSTHPRALLGVMTVDDTVRSLVESGEVAFACGVSSEELGIKAAQMVQRMMAHQSPAEDLVGMEQQDGNYYYYCGEVLKATVD
jgi:hypothetical protein